MCVEGANVPAPETDRCLEPSRQGGTLTNKRAPRALQTAPGALSTGAWLWPTVGGRGGGRCLDLVKVDTENNEHVKIYYPQVRGGGHSYQCLMSALLN